MIALPICINWQSIEGVDQFEYLGNVAYADGGRELDIGRRIEGAGSALTTLSKIGNAVISTSTLNKDCSVLVLI